MKTIKIQSISVVVTLILVTACSTKKDTFATRNFQALNTKYNVVFNGNEALNKGVSDLKLNYKDNFFEILPVERQLPALINKPSEEGEGTKNVDFALAETKATKAIQKRSIYIDGTERNYQIDEAYLLLGKSRYYDQRLVPALEAFNYILYKYPASDKIYEAKLWREKVNIRLDNEDIAIDNLKKLLQNKNFKPQIYADANAVLAEAFVKINKNDSAIAHIKQAVNFTKNKEEKARYHFILGQLYENKTYKDSAYAAYQSVIEMNRKAPRVYMLRAHAKQMGLLDINKMDTIAFFKKFDKLITDRENRLFLDVLHHQLALYYDKKNNLKQAKKEYILSLKNKNWDEYLQASNYRNLANIYFDKHKYVVAGKYFDSTLTKINDKSKEYKSIKKKRDNLDDVIKYETISQENDSILSIIAMNDVDRKNYFSKHIAVLKQQDALQKSIKNTEFNTPKTTNDNLKENTPQNISNRMPPSIQTIGKQSNFYFYNTNTVSYGKIEFKKMWGNRTLQNNWRNISLTDNVSKVDDNQDINSNDTQNNYKIEPKYTTNFYTEKLPKDAEIIDVLIKDQNFAYYQLGLIYKDKFKEYILAKDKLELLLTKKPEERLVLPAMYNLFKIYEIIDREKTFTMKNEIITKYPESRYAQILGNKPGNKSLQTPEEAYNTVFKTYIDRDYKKALIDIETTINQFNGEDIIPKLELLKVTIQGKIFGLTAYKKGINFIALNYPNVLEGKTAQEYLDNQIPAMEALQFNQATPTSWKIVYQTGNIEDKKAKYIIEKVTKFSHDRSPRKPIFSIDLYSMTENFVVLHGFKSEEQAIGLAAVLLDVKDYKISDKPIIISNDNYKIVQIKKNLTDYLLDPKKIPKIDDLAQETKQAEVEKSANEMAKEEIIKLNSEQTPSLNDGAYDGPPRSMQPINKETENLKPFKN